MFLDIVFADPRPGPHSLTCGSHKSIEFSRSKAVLGSINSIERSRVSELQNPEEDRPLAPHWRATCCQYVGCVVFHIDDYVGCVDFTSMIISLPNPDAISVSFQVQQRGIGATQEVINKLMEGVPMADAQPVLLVGCLPNRSLV